MLSVIFRKSIPLFLLGTCFVFAAGCSSTPEKDVGEIPGAVNADENLMGDSDSGNAAGLQTVHFPFDSFSLDSKSRYKLIGNAEIMKKQSSLAVQIEGHCDSRGGIQ